MRARRYPDVILDAGDGDAFLVTISDDSMRAAFRQANWLCRPLDIGSLWSCPDMDVAPYDPGGEPSAAGEMLFAAPVILDVGGVGEAEQNALSRLTWRPDLGGWLFLGAPQAEYDRYAAETAATVVEADGTRWTTRLPNAVLEDTAALAAAISGDLHDTHPRDYAGSWEPGDPLPTLEGASVHVGDELVARLTADVVVGAGSTPVRKSETGAPGYLIYRADKPVWPGGAVAWYAAEPGPHTVAAHTGGAGGVIERLADGALLSPESRESPAVSGPGGP